MKPVVFSTTFGILIFFLSLFFPSQIFAAISITSISPTIITSPEEVITISVTTSNLSSSTQYLQAAFREQGEQNYFGYTKNNNDSWYTYKASPTTDDFSSYFFSFIPINGSWTGQVFAKLDIASSEFKGPGEYTVKLKKYITSSAADSNDYTFTVNYALPTSTPTLAPSSTPTNVPTPTKTPTPIKTPTPTKIPTPTALPKPQTQLPTPTTKPFPTSKPSTKDGDVLAASDSPEINLVLRQATESLEPMPTATVAGVVTRGNSILIFFITGGILFILSGILLAWKRISAKASSTLNE